MSLLFYLPQCSNCSKIARGSSGVGGQEVESRHARCGIGRGASSIPLWGGQCPLLKNFRFLILNRRIFVDCLLFSAKIYLYNQKMPKWQFAWDAVHAGWRWMLIIRSKPFIDSKVIWARGGCSDPRGDWNLPELRGRSNELGGSSPTPTIRALTCLISCTTLK